MWTQTENAELMRLWPTHSASEIAAKLGRTRNAVIGRKHRIDRTYAGHLYGNEITRREEVVEERKLKASREAAAIAKMRTDLRKRPRNDAMRIAFENGARLVAIGAVFGITRQAVSLIVLAGRKNQL